MTMHTRTVRLPHGYTATFSAALPTAGQLHMQEVQWAPGFPSIENRRAKRKFYAAYTRARDEFFREVATMSGLTIAVFDANGQVAIRPETRQ